MRPLWERVLNDFGAMTQQATDEIRELRHEVERLKRDGSPGVLHEVDQAFYDLTVKERDRAEAQARRLEYDFGYISRECDGVHDLLDQAKAANKALKIALVECAIPLEVLAAFINGNQAGHLSQAVQDGILNAINHIHRALGIKDSTQPEGMNTCNPDEGFCSARTDETHCEHWWDDQPCCACGHNETDEHEAAKVEDGGER